MPISHDLAVEFTRNLSLVLKRIKAARAQQVRVRPELEQSAFPIMFCLNETGPKRISAIAEIIHSDVSTVSRQVHALENQELVTKAPDPKDGRASVIQLSSHGQQVLCDLTDQHAEWIKATLQGWDDQELEALNASLMRLYDSMGAAEHSIHTHDTQKENA